MHPLIGHEIFLMHQLPVVNHSMPFHSWHVHRQDLLSLLRQLHLIDAEPSNSHTIFVKSIDKLDNFDLAQHFNTDPELVGTGNMLSKEQIENFDVSDLEFKVPAGYQEFESFKKDEKVLRKSLDKNLMDKKMMGKKEKFKVIDEDKKVVKWFRERKR